MKIKSRIAFILGMLTVRELASRFLTGTIYNIVLISVMAIVIGVRVLLKHNEHTTPAKPMVALYPSGGNQPPLTAENKNVANV